VQLIELRKNMGRSLVPKGGDDRVYTPDELALKIVRHFTPTGKILEPCRGGGAFVRAVKKVTGKEPDWCEIDTEVLNGEPARDFLTHDFQSQTYNWIVSNPPYSQILDFMDRAMDLADNVVFLVQATVPQFTAKQRLMAKRGFELRETYRVATPPEWRAKGLAFGTGLAAVHWQRGYSGPIHNKRARDWKKGFTPRAIILACLAIMLGGAALVSVGRWLSWW